MFILFFYPPILVGFPRKNRRPASVCALVCISPVGIGFQHTGFLKQLVNKADVSG